MSAKAPEPEAAAAEDAAAPAKAPSPWLPLIVVLVLMPAISYATTQFLLLPKIRGAVLEQKALAHAAKPEAGHGKSEKGGHGAPKGGHGAAKGGHGAAKGGHGESGSGGGAGDAFSHDFESVVVNLAGSMGSRYLKTTFTALSENPDLKTLMEENKKQLLDVALTVLSSRTLADLEQPGAKNVVRNDLMANFNQALKSDVITQIYFSDFVIQ